MENKKATAFDKAIGKNYAERYTIFRNELVSDSESAALMVVASLLHEIITKTDTIQSPASKQEKKTSRADI